MDVNDDAFILNVRVALRFIASKLAPTNRAAFFYKIAALLRWACLRYRPSSRAGNGLL